MQSLTLRHFKLPDEALFDILNRDAVLWVGTGLDESPSAVELIARLMLLPWKLVLCESSASGLVLALSTIATESDGLSSHRGFLHLVGADPSTRQLPTRALPVYLLNGRDDAGDRAESSTLVGMAAQRRRLNMLERLQSASPKRVVLIGPDLRSVVEQLEDLWRSDFRSLLTFVLPTEDDVSEIERRCGGLADLSSISIVFSSVEDFARDAIERSLALLPDASIVLRVRDTEGHISEIDVSLAELPEQPILENFEIIKSKDLRRLTEADLTVEDIDGFFGRTNHSWRAYAAGLPWVQDSSCSKTLIKSLTRAFREGPDANCILFVVSEAGAGGTTLARRLAFEAASEGYPTLLAKPHVYEPDATAVVSFLNRFLAINEVAERQSVGTTPKSTRGEIPWFVVFDRDQWDGQEYQLGNFLSEVTRSGRKVVVLKVLGQIVPSSLPPGKEIASLSHELDRDQVLSLGTHLNRFLRPFGRVKKESDWERFWEQHKPDLDTSIAAFWVTLDFWLRGLIDLGESVQSWLLRQFKGCSMSTDLQTVLLEIAALTIERRSVPEQLLPLPSSTLRPLSVLLEDLRVEMPSLALVRQSTSEGRLWAMAHDVLGRYLINACYHERP